eukprot:730815-Rhodomonas_salina.1
MILRQRYNGASLAQYRMPRSCVRAQSTLASASSVPELQANLCVVYMCIYSTNMRFLCKKACWTRASKRWNSSVTSSFCFECVGATKSTSTTPSTPRPLEDAELYGSHMHRISRFR